MLVEEGECVQNVVVSASECCEVVMRQVVDESRTAGTEGVAVVVVERPRRIMWQLLERVVTLATESLQNDRLGVLFRVHQLEVDLESNAPVGNEYDQHLFCPRVLKNPCS